MNLNEFSKKEGFATMKRSEINQLLKNAISFMDEMNFKLPKFAYWTPEMWQSKGAECDTIREAQLGWDITDFGSGDFTHIGLLLFTVRNGSLKAGLNQKPYAEKIMIVEEGQITPMHFHWYKTEDIINRGGGNLMIKLYNSDKKEALADTEIEVLIDGCLHKLPAGSVVRLTPGESITLTKGLYHTFWAEEGCGKVLTGEVSMVNDDSNDNRFLEPAGRFPEIEEDETPIYLLANELP